MNGGLRKEGEKDLGGTWVINSDFNFFWSGKM